MISDCSSNEDNRNQCLLHASSKGQPEDEAKMGWVCGLEKWVPTTPFWRFRWGQVFKFRVQPACAKLGRSAVGDQSETGVDPLGDRCVCIS